MSAPVDTVSSLQHYSYQLLKHEDVSRQQHLVHPLTTRHQAKAATVESVPESPTTARPLEMDDDDVQESALAGDDATATKSTTTTAPGATSSTGITGSTEAPPPKPPRPVSEQQQNEQILKEAFPSIEASVIRAVLRASRGQVEPAFNALLEMTDPEAVQHDDEQPPPPPPRPVAAPIGQSATPADQLEADELYARRLAEHYENAGAYEARNANQGSGMPRGRQQTGLKPNEMYDDREHSFLDDDFPVIKESLKKGFMETQTKVNSWFNTLKKKIDEQFDENEDGQQGHGQSAFAGRPTRDQSRRSAEYDRYDADPELLSDDFGGLKFNSDGSEYPVFDSRTGGRPG